MPRQAAGGRFGRQRGGLRAEVELNRLIGQQAIEQRSGRPDDLPHVNLLLPPSSVIRIPANVILEAHEVGHKGGLRLTKRPLPAGRSVRFCPDS